jgi:uncharacterized protein YjbI with pentapeptide repeats
MLILIVTRKGGSPHFSRIRHFCHGLLGTMTSKGGPNIEVRLGAIYALERIAFDSPRDHWTIMEVLTAYVRQNASAIEQVSPGGTPQEMVASGSKTEVQAILNVLARRQRDSRREREGQYLDLSQSDLRKAILREAHMDGADFSDAEIQEANFRASHLRETRFMGVCAEGTVFVKAQAEKADFSGAHLEEADFTFADLSEVSFRNAHIERADFTSANLEKADFKDAYVDGANFVGATGLSVDQIKLAFCWNKAQFDAKFTLRLDRSVDPDASMSDSHPSV